MVKVLFVCYGNCCRSEMAEALANQLGEEKVQVLSAGKQLTQKARRMSVVSVLHRPGKDCQKGNKLTSFVMAGSSVHGGSCARKSG